MAGGLFGGGTGILSNPYIIEDALDLNEVRNNLSSFFRQVAHINLSTNYSEGWIPITGFTGGYNGDFYRIENLVGVGGLFDVVTRSSTGSGLSNIILKDIDINAGAGPIGGLCNTFNNNLSSAGILNCHVSGNLSATGSIIGGLVGYVVNALGTTVAELCSTNVSIIAGSVIGGICGRVYGNYTGGGQSVIRDCRSMGAISGVNTIGGICGNYNLKTSFSTGARGTITKCIASGNLWGESSVGGILATAGPTGNTSMTVSYCTSLHDTITRTFGSATSFGRIIPTATLSVNSTGLFGNRALDTMAFIT